MGFIGWLYYDTGEQHKKHWYSNQADHDDEDKRTVWFFSNWSHIDVQSQSDKDSMSGPSLFGWKLFVSCSTFWLQLPCAYGSRKRLASMLYCVGCLTLKIKTLITSSQQHFFELMQKKGRGRETGPEAQIKDLEMLIIKKQAPLKRSWLVGG